MLAELEFVLLGVVYQLLSIVFESARITLVQILIQRKGLRLNPITARPVCWQGAAAAFVFDRKAKASICHRVWQRLHAED